MAAISFLTDDSGTDSTFEPPMVPGGPTLGRRRQRALGPNVQVNFPRGGRGVSCGSLLTNTVEAALKGPPPVDCHEPAPREGPSEGGRRPHGESEHKTSGPSPVVHEGATMEPYPYPYP